MKILTIINPENVTDAEVANYPVRTAARAIVRDKEDNVGILYVAKKNYHKLPGGGIEVGEDTLTALKRECKEELGCDIEVMGEVGQITEYRKIFQIKQTSFCYLADLVGGKGMPSFTKEESENAFQIQWLPIEKAMSLLADDQPKNDEGKFYIVPRDRVFLEAAKKQY